MWIVDSHGVEVEGLGAIAQQAGAKAVLATLWPALRASRVDPVVALHAELAAPIEAVIGAAREQRAARVAALEAELEQARKALAEIEA